MVNVAQKSFIYIILCLQMAMFRYIGLELRKNWRKSLKPVGTEEQKNLKPKF